MTRRFILFLFGVFLGFLFIQFAFPGRFSQLFRYFDVDYRVLYHLKQDTISISQKTKCCLKEFGLSNSDLIDVLKNGEVNFNLSESNTKPCKKYLVENDKVSVYFKLCDTNVEIIDFFTDKNKCICN